MDAPLRFIPTVDNTNSPVALNQQRWVEFACNAANAQGPRKVRPYVYDITLATGEKAYYLLNSNERRNFTRNNQGSSCRKLNLKEIVRISEAILPIPRSPISRGQKTQLCAAMIKMAENFEKKHSSGCATAARKIANNFSNLSKTIKQPLPESSGQCARRVVNANPYIEEAVQPPVPTTLEKIDIFVTNLIKSSNFWNGIKFLALAGSAVLIVVTGRLEMIAVLIATAILQKIFVNKLMEGCVN